MLIISIVEVRQPEGCTGLVVVSVCWLLEDGEHWDLTVALFLVFLFLGLPLGCL